MQPPRILTTPFAVIAVTLLTTTDNTAAQVRQLSADPATSAAQIADDRLVRSWIALLDDKRMHSRAAAALLRLGSRAIPELRRALRPRADDRKARFDRSILDLLARLGPDAVAMTDDLSALLRLVPTGEVAVVMHAVANIAPHAKGWAQDYMDGINRLTRKHLDATEDPDQGLAIRREFVRLSIRAAVAKQTTAQLLEQLDTNAIVAREIAAEVLGRDRTASAVEPLQKCLRELKPPRITRQSAFGLHFHIEADGYHATAATALLKIVGTGSAQALPALEYRLTHGDRLQRQQAALDLGALEQAAAPSVSVLVDVARGADPEVAREAITALGRIGPAARTATPTLVELTRHENKQIRHRAEAALRALR